MRLGGEGIACDFVGGVRIGHRWGGCMLQETGDALAVGRFPWDEPVMPWLAHAHCGEEALPPLRDKTLPASVVCISTGIIFLPARLEWAEIGVFCCAGRVLYRLWPYTPCAGRVLYRFGLEVGVAGRVLYRWAPVRGFTGQQWKISTPVTRRSVRARSARVRWPPEGPR